MNARGIATLLPALTLVVALAGCGGAVEHRGDPSLQAELRLSPTPPMVGSAGVSVRATDGADDLAPPGEVLVSVRGASTTPVRLDFERGAWVGLLDFPASGEVRVEVRITAADGRRATVAVPVRVVGRP